MNEISKKQKKPAAERNTCLTAVTALKSGRRENVPASSGGDSHGEIAVCAPY